jgi:HD-GYP domain-containing protein (c-di-GMP phosphodiesterase class II)
MKGLTWKADRNVRIGSREDQEVLLIDKSVSPQHAELICDGESWYVRDLGSSTGTFVNAARLGPVPQPLHERDTVRCGNQCLLVTEICSTLRGHVRDGKCAVEVRAAVRPSWEHAMETWARYEELRRQRGTPLPPLTREGYHPCLLESFEELLRLLLRDLLVLLDARSGRVFLADDNTGCLVLSATDPAGQSPLADLTLVEHCFRRTESLLGSDTATQALAPAKPDAPSRERDFTICALLRSRRTVLGVVRLDRGCGDEPFALADLSAADAFAVSVSPSIESGALLRRQRDRALHIMAALAEALDLHNQYLPGHSRHMMTYSVMLAEELGLSPAHGEDVQLAALVRDIGMSAVRDRIRTKPGKLTPSEFEEVKAHPARGALLLAVDPDLGALAPIVRGHHERWVGTGYPDGLSGGQIPRLARIITVADAFDAMTTARPYRAPLSLDRGFEELSAQAGRQFDPELVRAFLALRPRIEALARPSPVNAAPVVQAASAGCETVALAPTLVS